VNPTRFRGKALTLPILFLITGAMLGQGENEAYFSLSSGRTFGSGGKPTIEMTGWNVDALEFRVYRINDPTLFFRQLERPHEFGGRAPAPPRNRTVLEQVRSWKRGLRADIRRSLRAQFTESPREHLETLLPGTTPGTTSDAAPAPGLKTTPARRYAEAPLLNAEQMVVSFTRPVQARSRWNREEVEIPVTDTGVYLVEAVNHDLRAYTVVFVSDLVMVTKSANGNILNFVVDRKTGLPQPGIEVRAFTKTTELPAVKTDRDGIAAFHQPARQPNQPADGNELTIIARQGRNVAVNAMYAPRHADDWTGYIYTDRPVYRPGHTVHFKALLRLRGTDVYAVPAGRSVSVEITDADQKPAYQKTLIISATGTLDGELALAAGAPLGQYNILVKAEGAGQQDEGNGGYMSGNFEVQEYRKPEYEVRVTPAKMRVLQGEKVQAVIDARYFFGEPVSGARVKYSVYRTPWFFPLWYDRDEDTEDDQNANNDSDMSGDQLTDQEGTLDAEGKLSIEIPTPVSEHGQDFLYRVEAHVTDAANREVIGAGRVVATYGSFAINVAPDRYVYEPGAQAVITIQARDYDSKPVGTRAHVELLRWNYGQRTAPRSSESISATDVELGASGDATTTIAIPKTGGSFFVRATAKTPEGREVFSRSYLWISGGIWAQGAGQQRTISIVPDRKTYRPGDTAKILIVTGQPGVSVLATVEGRDVRQRSILQSKGSGVTLEIPIDAKFEPGITVEALFIRDGVTWRGTKYVRIPPAEHELKVRLATDKPQYLPGETADYSLDVTDNADKPVPRAEFSLGVVDEAIYGVRPDSTPALMSFFFGREYNRVSTQSSLEYYFSGQAGKQRMRLADLRPRSRLAQLKPDRLVQPKIRKAFPDTAFWAPALVTDSNGHAHAKVDFPDSLTTWRATARGITQTTSVGAATLKTIVRKNLILRLVTPRFLVQGDEVTISALVHNYLPVAKTARVSLDVQGLDILSGKTQDVPIPSRGEAKVEWRVKPQRTRSVTLTGKALTDLESDAIELRLPVNFAGLKRSASKGGSLKAGDSAEFDMAFPAKPEEGSRSLSIRVAPSITGSLFAALDYLTSFPYGCVEQTMSSFLPNIVVKDAVQSLGLKTTLDDAALQQKIRVGLDRLYGFQHQDGGWGWWQTDDSHPFMTAYVVAGLVQARAAGTEVNNDAILRGVGWLKKTLAADSRLKPDFRAYLLYSLSVAGQADATELSALFARRSELTPYGMALLGLALENAKDANAKDARATDIATALESSVRQEGEEAWWPATRDPMLDFEIDATPEATAFVTKFLSHQRKDSPLLPKAAAWLVNHRNEGYWWASTKQTAMVIYGLIDYLKVTNELKPNLTVTVFVNGKSALTRKLGQTGAINPPDLVLDESQLNPGVNKIRVVTSGEGRLYYGTRAEYFSSEVQLQKSGTASLNLLRDYFRLVPGKSGDKIVYDIAPLDGPVAPGDTIAVRLTVTGSQWKYMMLEDPIPAGTEFIEKDNLYEMRVRPPWWQWYFDRRELHDDRMAVFQTYFPQGQREYFYLLKVVNPGVFQANPARVGPMYQLEIAATTESRRLEIRQ
jgi:uncharacterized protein YfaS (alpha-2-macroglobulin family)